MAQGFDAPPTIKRSGSEHRRAVTSFPLMVKGKAWLGIKDPPAGEGQEGQKTPLWQRRDGVDRRLHDDAGISASGRRKDYVAM